MAFIHTPNALSTSLGLVAAILLGDFAVQWAFCTQTILYRHTLSPSSPYQIMNLLWPFVISSNDSTLTGLFSYWGLR